MKNLMNMTINNIRQEVDSFRHIEPFPLDDQPDTMIFSCTVFPPKEWDKGSLETALQVTIPVELEHLWTEASRLELYKDETYGQWGIIIWSPETVLTAQKSVKEDRERDFLNGDLAIGEFLGDSDIILLRCNPSQPDFGAIVIAEPILGREYWTTAADSLCMYLHKLRETNGQNKW